jgi:hypothetical protein
MNERSGGPVAVCVLTLERQAGYVLITVRTSADARRSAETVRVTRHTEEALRWVRELIAAHEAGLAGRPERP